mgnify:CR=1 FL=1
MTSTIQPTKQTITVQGSAEIITDFMEYSINIILYNRELYPMEDFEKVEKYGRPYYLTTNYKLKSYLENVLKGLKDLVANDQCHRIDLVIISVELKKVIRKLFFLQKMLLHLGDILSHVLEMKFMQIQVQLLGL